MVFYSLTQNQPQTIGAVCGDTSKKLAHGAKLVGTCACTAMAPDVPADNQMLGHDGTEDHGDDERGDSTRRASRLEKGKSVKQSAGIQPDEEPVTHKH